MYSIFNKILSKKNFRLLDVSALTLSAILCLFFLFLSSKWNFQFHFLYLQVISPYLFLFIISSLIIRERPLSPTFSLASCIASIFMLLITLIIYIDSLLIHFSSTSSLIFLYFPLYLLLGGPIILLSIWVILALVSHKKDGQRSGRPLRRDKPA